ncbi:MAG TPA: cellulase family glycosylhydrolase [Bacteroidales bacterium]|nr:cellulase family glycosylhydrolase [Bacteroidales bacterium]
MKKFILLIAAIAMAVSCEKPQNNFLFAEGKQIVTEQGENVLLRGIGLGGWMLQEPYMLKLSGAAVAQYDIRNKITELIGQERCSEFYAAWLRNMITERDIDSIKAWGFNSIRLPMHYNMFTLPVEQEPVAGQDTWKEEGFRMTDELLSWCRKNEIWLILDLHAAPGGQGNDIPIADVDTLKPKLWESEENMRKTVALWRKLAERYKDEEWIGGYDLINETNYPMEANKQLKELFLSITKAVREVDTKHIIFIEGNDFANNYTGLTPPWDENMVYSFHKYWNPTTTETIQKYLDLREEFNVPFWMGESGENNNEWYRSAVQLFESNNIGWAWWTIKKVDSESGIMNVTRPDGYQAIIDYWSGTGDRPDPDEAYRTLMQLAEAVKIENCRVNYPVLDALF